MLTRQTTARVLIAGHDVTKDISPYLKSVQYEDVLSGETDVVELELQDKNRLFMKDWFPNRGDTLEVELLMVNWRGAGQFQTLPLGTFEIDEITNSYPPHLVRIKGNSCPSSSALRQVDESKSWENVKLSQIAADVARAAGVDLIYDTEEDPDIARAERAESPSLAFLDKLCADYYLSLKFTDGKLIIFDTEKLEGQDPVLTFDYDLSIIKRFNASATLTDIYKACEVNYKHGQKDEKFSARVEDITKTSGKTLRLNQKVNSQAEAQKLAQHKLRDKNKEEIKINLTTIGDLRLLSGNVIELVNHGVYSGRYLIKKARHKVGTGYEVNMECYRCGG